MHINSDLEEIMEGHNQGLLNECYYHAKNQQRHVKTTRGTWREWLHVTRRAGEDVRMREGRIHKESVHHTVKGAEVTTDAKEGAPTEHPEGKIVGYGQRIWYI